VIVPAMTTTFTAAVVAAGAIGDGGRRSAPLTLDARACADAITRTGPSCRCTYADRLPTCWDLTVADRHRLVVIEDCCERIWPPAAAGRHHRRGRSFSFYPQEPWRVGGRRGGAHDDSALADRVRLLRNGGQTGRNVRAGRASRLDELQAAILRVRLPNLPPKRPCGACAAFCRDA
jgi:hypothetical protein